jgi:hypothetical protein
MSSGALAVGAFLTLQLECCFLYLVLPNNIELWHTGASVPRGDDNTRAAPLKTKLWMSGHRHASRVNLIMNETRWVSFVFGRAASCSRLEQKKNFQKELKTERYKQRCY